MRRRYTNLKTTMKKPAKGEIVEKARRVFVHNINDKNKRYFLSLSKREQKEFILRILAEGGLNN